jgi:hypothetical protein
VRENLVRVLRNGRCTFLLIREPVLVCMFGRDYIFKHRQTFMRASTAHAQDLLPVFLQTRYQRQQAPSGRQSDDAKAVMMGADVFLFSWLVHDLTHLLRPLWCRREVLGQRWAANR